MKLEFRPSADWNKKTPERNLATADESTLRYDVLLGDFILEIGGVDFSARWGWVPLLDLAYCLKKMSDEMMTGEPEAKFEFTESDAWIRFLRTNDSLEVSSSYALSKATADRPELCELLTTSSREFFTRVANQNVDLRSNPAFQRMQAEVFGPPIPEPFTGARPN